MEGNSSTFEHTYNFTDFDPFFNGSTTFDQDGEIEEPLIYVLTVGFGLTLGLINNTLSLLYIKYKLKINEHIGRILTISALHYMFLLSLTLLGFCLVQFGIRNLYTCSLFVLSGFICFTA